ncbi:GGDEF domain-containing protein [Sphingomonas xinjiangensis]|uniref:diguanylate cyclase n=1 Tax=Sphingomonas xinjiangensis TaxID=643568 RepID=A0A840YT28_9SPHN|nr:GGDEF domain-containing protein [Sphingomonas xinjiangensis]MBB5712825.1 diguanylate cyclase [Sphingomonas xinjiangensis]
MNDETEAPGMQVLRFLDEHDLEHTPTHYTFAHRHLFGNEADFSSKVHDLIDRRTRISADDVERLNPEAASSEFPLGQLVPKLDQVTLRLLDIIRGTLDATSMLNRNLVQASASLLDAADLNTRAIVAAMILQTAEAEKKLEETIRQAQALRDELSFVARGESRDPVTGLYNRAATERNLAAAAEGSCCTALVNIDHFRQLNDVHGSGVGDRVLKLLATTLEDCCAPHLVGRWGGEEFLIILESAAIGSAAALVEKARATLTAKRLRVRDSDQPLGTISFSAGVVASRGRSPAEIIEAAEALLQRAKRNGRNQVLSETNLVGLDGAP